MIVSFTGTRHGMSETQKDQFAFVISYFKSGTNAFHYGTHHDVNLLADREAESIARAVGFTTKAHNAFRGEELERNRELVACGDILIAAPLSDEEVLRSGTWMTIRAARKAGKPVVMLSRGKA